MKKVLILIFLMFASAAASGFQITREWLSASEFSDHGSIWGAVLSFNADGTYKMEYSSEGWDWTDSGRYELSGSGAVLKPSSCNGKAYTKPADSELSMGEAEVTVAEKKDDLRYGSYLSVKSRFNKKNLVGQDLVCDTMLFPVKDSLLRNAPRSHKGIPVITMGCAKGVTVSNVKIRKGPSVSAEALSYMRSHGDDAQDFVPQGTKVTVIARTVKKEKVLSWENYWYLVDAGAEEEVWMYGEFVRLD